jgi:membrane-associated protease RseP (regulator of RpoE activity)
MVEFWVYDVAFLILFVIGIFYFLRKHNKTLDKEGWMYMYRTKWGMNLINKIGTNYSGLLGKLRYLVVVVGYFLMAGIVWLFGMTVFEYIRNPAISEAIKAPPIAPLIPYFPKLFGMESFFPNFYFTYFLVAIAIVAFVHEFSHGIFMKFSKVKIKSTGIVFLGPILGAFVEEDRKSFDGKGKFNRLSILGAGVFANLVTGILFLLLAWGMFNVAYVSNGYIIEDYASIVVPVDSILGVSNYTEELVLINTTYGEYVWFEGIEMVLLNNYTKLYLNSPAIENGIRGSVMSIDGEKIEGKNDFYGSFDNLGPGDEIILGTIEDGVENYHEIILGEHPFKNDTGFLGISGGRMLGVEGGLDPKASFKEFSMYSLLSYLKGSVIDYQPIYSFFGFVFNLFWWIVIINFLVALFNMLPLGILDGGQFLFVTILGITKSEKWSKRIYSLSGKLILLGFLAIMAVWAFRVLL